VIAESAQLRPTAHLHQQRETAETPRDGQTSVGVPSAAARRSPSRLYLAVALRRLSHRGIAPVHGCAFQSSHRVLRLPTAELSVAALCAPLSTYGMRTPAADRRRNAAGLSLEEHRPVSRLPGAAAGSNFESPVHYLVAVVETS
jgi:hypothetical protein